MYLKILSKDDDQTNTLMDVQQVQYWSDVGSPEVIKEKANYADLSVLADSFMKADNDKLEPSIRVGHFNVTFKTGKHLFVVFDSLAFLCNESGKAVERYLAN